MGASRLSIFRRARFPGNCPISSRGYDLDHLCGGAATLPNMLGVAQALGIVILTPKNSFRPT